MEGSGGLERSAFLTASTLGGCGVPERTDFSRFLIWAGHGGLEISDFLQFLLLGGCGGLGRPDFYQFLLWEGIVVLKELIFHSFYIGRVWWS